MANCLLLLKNHSVLLNYLFLSKEMTFKNKEGALESAEKSLKKIKFMDV